MPVEIREAPKLDSTRVFTLAQYKGRGNMADPKQPVSALSVEGYQQELLALCEAARVECRNEDAQFTKLIDVKASQIQGGKLDAGRMRQSMEEKDNFETIKTQLNATREDIRNLHADAVDALREEGPHAAPAA